MATNTPQTPGEALKMLLDYLHDLDPQKIRAIEIKQEADMVDIAIDGFGQLKKQTIGTEVIIRMRLLP